MGLKAIPQTEMTVRLPKTYNYLKRFEVELRARAGYQRYFQDTAPFYSMFNVGSYSFAPFRVCWAREDKELRAAVASDVVADEWVLHKRIVADQTVQFVPCEGGDEAHYICSLLNNSVANYVALSYTSDITTRIMNAIPIKRFDRANLTHLTLADLSQQAHAATAAGDAARVRELEAEVDRLAAKLWGLTDAELREIQESLAELG
jgi:hypothetical protein